jgi:hypothetical protein
MQQANRLFTIRHVGWFRAWSRRSAVSILLIALVLAGGSRTAAQDPMPASGEVQGKGFLLMTKLACDRAIPGYQAATAARYAAWRQDNAALVAQLEASPDFQRMRAEADKQQVTLTPAQQRLVEERCEEAADFLGPAGPPDPRFATPEKTWDLFQASLRAADRTTALACLVQQAKRRFKENTQQLGDGQLRRLADPPIALHLGERHGESQEGEVIRNGMASFILFVNVRGEWKIAQL